MVGGTLCVNMAAKNAVMERGIVQKAAPQRNLVPLVELETSASIPWFSAQRKTNCKVISSFTPDYIATSPVDITEQEERKYSCGITQGTYRAT